MCLTLRKKTHSFPPKSSSLMQPSVPVQGTWCNLQWRCSTLPAWANWRSGSLQHMTSRYGPGNVWAGGCFKPMDCCRMTRATHFVASCVSCVLWLDSYHLSHVCLIKTPNKRNKSWWQSYELRSKLCSWPIGHVQTGWSPIGCEGFEFLEFSLSEVIKVSEAVPLWWGADLLSALGCLLTVCFL